MKKSKIIKITLLLVLTAGIIGIFISCDNPLFPGTDDEQKASVLAPSFSPEAGTYDSDQSIEVSSGTDGATIYYTDDGTTPNNNSTEYTGPITITEGTTTIKAIAYKDGMNPSRVAIGIYLIEYENDIGSAPSKPQNLYVTAISKSSINVSWSSVDNADGYRLYYSLSPTYGYVMLRDTTSTSLLDNYLDESTTYYYRVSAYNEYGESQKTIYKQATTLSGSSVDRINSWITNDFDGLEYGNLYELANGQIWKQTEYYYWYYYYFWPEVTIYQTSYGVYKMKVEGISHEVTVTRVY